MAPDLILENARVLTMNPAAPTAQAVAILDGKIAAVGDLADIQELAGPETRRFDAQGNTVLPGFVESHLHLFAGAYGLQLLQLDEVQTADQLAQKLRAYAEANPAEGLLICKAADYNLFAGDVPPRKILDAALADRPVMLIAPDHHTAWTNSIGLEKAGILHGRALPVGNEIVMGADGLASGELQESQAMAPVFDLRTSGGRETLGMQGLEPATKPTPAQWASDLEVMQRGLEYCASFGFTSLHNMDGNRYQLELLQELETQGRLLCRVDVPFHMTPDKPISALQDAIQMRADFSSDLLSSKRVKVFMDGVIDSGTAYLLEDYADIPGTRGEPLHDAERFNQIAIEADRNGFQIAVHAIGDAAVRQVLDGYEAARKENGARDSRHRIEHLELVHPQDIDRVHSLGVIASMQPSHPPGSMDFPEEPWRSRVGPDRWVNAFPARALRGVGAPIPFASDWPVADLNPMRNIQAALTRKGFSPSCPDNRCSLMEALESYTSAGAYTGFEENIRGQLAPGYQADVVVLDADLETLEAEQIGDVAVVLTLQGGVETWKA